MSHQLIIRAVSWLLPLVLCAAATAHALQMVTEEDPPFNHTKNGKLTGLSTEVVAAIGKRAKVPMAFASMQWEQAYSRAQSNRETCAFSAVRLPNRERIFKWVGPIAAGEWGLYARKDFTGSLKTLADAKPYRIGAVAQDAKVEWLKERFVTNIITYANDTQIPPELRRGVVDLWVTGTYSAKRIAESAKGADIKLMLSISRFDYFIACNPGVPDSTVNAMSDALAAMQKDGSYHKILKNYDERFAP